MKIAHLKQPDVHKEDVNRMEQVFASYGILVAKPDIMLAWGMYSETKETEWIELPERDDDIYLALVNYFDITDW